MMKTSAFQQAIESVESLSLEDREILLDLLQKRLHQQRRTNLTQEFTQGQVKFGSVDQFLKELDEA